MDYAKRISRELEPLGTRKRADGSKAYLKSDLRFLGVTNGEMRAAVKAIVRETKQTMTHDALVALVDELWCDVFELRSAAVEFLIFRIDLLDAEDVPLIERLIRASKTWALVDSLAPFVMGALVLEYPALGKTLDRWSTDDDFWVRRAAMLSLLVPLRRGGGDFARFTRYADAMLEEKEFFIRKAIGWILRETGKQTPDRVYEWLLPRAPRAAGLTIREATKYLKKQQRDAIVKARG